MKGILYPQYLYLSAPFLAQQTDVKVMFNSGPANPRASHHRPPDPPTAEGFNTSQTEDRGRFIALYNNLREKSHNFF